MSFPKIVIQMGSFGEKRKKNVFSLLSADSRYFRISALKTFQTETVSKMKNQSS